jgi:Spy/CpxP family protein refolding chaperone
MLEARQAIMRAIGADAFDEPRIRAAAATVSVFEAGGALSMAKLFPKIRTVLTPDQQQLLQDAWSRPPMWARDPNTSPV